MKITEDDCERLVGSLGPEEPEESYHYKRTCAACGNVWWGLHCPHDGAQNPCGACGLRPTPVDEPEPDGCTCEFGPYEDA